MNKFLLLTLLVLTCMNDSFAGDKGKEEGIPIDSIYKSRLASGSLLLSQSSYDKALTVFEELIADYNQNPQSSLGTAIASVLALESNKLANQGEYNTALDLGIKGIKIVEENDNDAQLLSKMYITVGNIYSVFEDHEKAYPYYLEGLSYVRETGDVNLQFSYLNNLTAVCCYIKELAKAEEFNQAAHDLPLGDKAKQNYFYALNKGFIAMAGDKLLHAIEAYKESLQYAQEPGMMPQWLAASYSELYRVFEEKGDLDSSLFYLIKYKDLSESEGFVYMQVDAYKSLSRIYQKLKDTEKADYYLNQYVTLGDSMMNNREFNRIRNKQASYEEAKSNSYINELSTTIAAQKTILFIILALFFGGLLLTILLYFQKKKLQHAYRDLFARNKELVKIESKYAEAQKTIVQLRENKTVEVQAKTTGTGLKDEQREQLLHKINLVMDDEAVYSNPDFNLAELAHMVDSNTKYVSQMINETYGMNFRTYINNYRIKLSRKRLSDTESYGNFTIKAISESVGFKSQSSFIESFRKVTGITPSMFQNMAQKSEVL